MTHLAEAAAGRTPGYSPAAADSLALALVLAGKRSDLPGPGRSGDSQEEGRIHSLSGPSRPRDGSRTTSEGWQPCLRKSRPSCGVIESCLVQVASV